MFIVIGRAVPVSKTCLSRTCLSFSSFLENRSPKRLHTGHRASAGPRQQTRRAWSQSGERSSRKSKEGAQDGRQQQIIIIIIVYFGCIFAVFLSSDLFPPACVSRRQLALKNTGLVWWGRGAARRWGHFYLKSILGLCFNWWSFQIKSTRGTRSRPGSSFTHWTSMPWWNHKMHILSIYLEIRFVFVDCYFYIITLSWAVAVAMISPKINKDIRIL